MRGKFIIAGWAAAALAAGLSRATAKVPAGPLLIAGLAAPTTAFAWLFRRHHTFRRWVLQHDPRRTTLIQSFRVFGSGFLIPYRRGALAGAYAIPTIMADASIGLTAPLVACRLDPAGREFRLWHAAGLSFLVMSVGLGALTSPPLQKLGDGPTSQAMADFPLSLVPTFLGPMVLLAHLAALARVKRSAPRIHL